MKEKEHSEDTLSRALAILAVLIAASSTVISVWSNRIAVEANRISKEQSQLLRATDLEPLFRLEVETRRDESGETYQRLRLYNEGGPVRALFVDTNDFLTDETQLPVVSVFYWFVPRLTQRKTGLLAVVDAYIDHERVGSDFPDSRNSEAELRRLRKEIGYSTYIMSYLQIEYSDVGGSDHEVCFRLTDALSSGNFALDTTMLEPIEDAEFCRTVWFAFFSEGPGPYNLYELDTSFLKARIEGQVLRDQLVALRNHPRLEEY